MEKTVIVNRDKRYSRLYAFISLLLICFYLVTELVFQLWYRVAANYGLFLIVSFIAISFFLRFFNSSKEEKCVVFYAVWVLITRVLNGDRFLDIEFYFLVRTVLFTGCFLCIGFVLDAQDRKSFFNLVCAIVCGYWFVLAVIGLYATLSFVRITLPPSDTTIGCALWGGNYQLTLDNIHRNVTGTWFALAVILMLYQFISCKKAVWKALTAIAAVVFYFATAMSFCRAAQVGLCVAITMLVLLLVLERVSKKSIKVKAVLAACIIAVCLPLSYAGYGAVTGICSVISSRLTDGTAEIRILGADTVDEATAVPAEEDASDETSFVIEENDEAETAFEAEENEEIAVVAAEEEAGETTPIFTESRGEENVMALGGRTYLWRAGILTLKEEPERLVKGGMLGEYMERVVEICTELANRKVPDVNSQMHNFLLDSLLLTGIPGALTLLLFTIFVVIRMVKVFFSADGSVPMQLKLLTLPLAFLFVDNMMEAHIFRYALVTSILFFFICGIFLAWSYEVLPAKKRKCPRN